MWCLCWQECFTNVACKCALLNLRLTPPILIPCTFPSISGTTTEMPPSWIIRLNGINSSRKQYAVCMSCCFSQETQIGRRHRELYRLVIVDTPLAPYFSQCSNQEDLDELNVEIMRNILYKVSTDLQNPCFSNELRRPMFFETHQSWHL